MAEMSNNPGDSIYLKRILDDINESIAKQEAVEADIRPMANTFFRPSGGATTYGPIPVQGAEQTLNDLKARSEQANAEYDAGTAALEAGPVPTNEALDDVALNMVTGTQTGPYNPNPDIPSSTEDLRTKVMADLDESIGLETTAAETPTAEAPTAETPTEGFEPARVRVRDYVAQRRGLQGPTLEDLKSAQGRAGTKRFLANMNRATKDYLAGISGAKQGTSVASGLEAEADAEIQNISDQQKLISSNQTQAKQEQSLETGEIALQNDRNASDPNSEISVAMRRIAQEQGLPVTSGMTAIEVKELVNKNKKDKDSKFLRIGKTPSGQTNYMWIGEDGTIEDTGVSAVTAGLVKDEQGRLVQAGEILSERSDTKESTKEDKPVYFGEPGKQTVKQPDFGQKGKVYFTPAQTKEFSDIQKDFDKSVEKVKAQIDGGRVVADAAGKNKLDYALVRTQLPRLMGEVGNLAAFEQEVWEGDPNIFNKFERFFRKNFSFDTEKGQWIGDRDGSLTPEDADAINQIVAETIKKRAQRYITTARQAANRAQTQGIDKEYAEYRLLQDEPLFKGYTNKLASAPQESAQQQTVEETKSVQLPEKVRIRRKEDGVEKTITREQAQKILEGKNSEKYEVVQ